MKVEKTSRSFEIIEFIDAYDEPCSLQQSSAIDDGLVDAINRPGYSFLWFGRPAVDSGRMHLSRAQVADLVRHLQAWLDTGSLEVKA